MVCLFTFTDIQFFYAKIGMARPMNLPYTPGSLKRALRSSEAMAAT